MHICIYVYSQTYAKKMLTMLSWEHSTFMTVRSRYVQTGTNLSRVTITVYCNYTAGQIYRWYMAIPMQFL